VVSSKSRGGRERRYELRINSLKKNEREKDHECIDAHCIIEYILPYSELEKLIEE